MPLLRKPILIIQLRPEDATADSEFRAILRYGGLRDGDVVRVRAERAGLPAVAFEDFSAIIVGGSPFDMSTPADAKSAIQKRVEGDFMRLFDAITAVDFPFLGACSGNSLLGAYCGASISTRYAEPVGGADVTLTDAGTRDPLLEGFPRSFRVLLGHKEACDTTPPGTVLLASSVACPVQMFRLGRNAYATQFHPEADFDGFKVRIEVYKDHGYFAAETADELIAAVAQETVTVPQRILRRFVVRYRDRASTSEAAG